MIDNIFSILLCFNTSAKIAKNDKKVELKKSIL